ncbi:MAG TPA: Gfo/Idh/MocA family oxidoreductase, partial [Acetobacteraceae bacterium]
EKALTDNLAQARELKAIADDAGLTFMVNYNYRYMETVVELKQRIDAGEFGDLAFINICGHGYTFHHSIDLLRFLCGEIDTVQAMRTSNARNLPVEDSAAVLLGFCSGALAAIALSDAVPSPWSWDLASGENAAWPRNDVATHLIAGTDASLSLPSLELWRYPGARGWAEKLARETLPHQQASPYERQIRHLCAVLRGAEAPLCGGRDAARTLAATLAVHEAAAIGKRVQPHAVPAPPPTDATA